MLVQQFMTGSHQELNDHMAEARALCEDETFLHQSETPSDAADDAMWFWGQDSATPCQILLNETMQGVFSDIHRVLIGGFSSLRSSLSAFMFAPRPSSSAKLVNCHPNLTTCGPSFDIISERTRLEVL